MLTTFLPKEFHPVEKRSFYDWVENGCTGSLSAISRYVPPVFESYIHICPPAWKLPESVDESEYRKLSEIEQENEMVPIRWSDAIKDRILHFDGLGSWGEVAPPRDYSKITPGTIRSPWEGLPTVAILNVVEKAVLTATVPDQVCICGFWEGFGGFSDELKLFTHAKTTNMAQQDHLLAQGAKSIVFDYWRSLLNRPHYWTNAPCEAPQAVWSPSKQWFYAVPFHRFSSIFGGTKEMAETLLESKEIEAYELPEGHVFKL